MSRKKLWFTLAVLASLLFALHPQHSRAALENPMQSVEGPFTPSLDCPPVDDYHWHKVREPDLLVLWVVPKRKFDWDIIGPHDAVTYHVGKTAIIYARRNLTETDGYLFHHEVCHAMGWVHDETTRVDAMPRWAR